MVWKSDIGLNSLHFFCSTVCNSKNGDSIPCNDADCNLRATAARLTNPPQRKTKRRPWAVLLGAVVGAAFVFPLELQAQFGEVLPPPNALQPGFDAISQELSHEWLNILAGPTFEGRGTGQLGYVRAAHWIAGKAAEFGLEPMGDGGTYFQMLPLDRLAIDAMHSVVVLPNGTPTGNAVPFHDKIGLFSFHNRPETKGKLTLLQLNSVPNAIDENAIRDRVVIYSAPGEKASEISLFLEKMRPAALLRITKSPAISTPQLKRPARGVLTNNGVIQLEFAKEIARTAGIENGWFQEIALETPDSSPLNSLQLESEIALQVRFREESITVPNVLAWLPGEDAEVNKEYVVLGAHLDHLGKQGLVYFPGADDNASGSTALLGIAKAMRVNPVRPKRSVLFSWFAAEEMGLVGSNYYCSNPALPLDRMCCMLNLDMVGRNEENDKETSQDNFKSLHLVGTQKGDPKLHELILDANRHIGFEFEYDEERVFLRSDQASFFKSGVSVGFLFGGFHPDYHAVTDTPDKINYQKVISAAKLFYLTAYAVAEYGRLPVPPPQTPSQTPSQTPTAEVNAGGSPAPVQSSATGIAN